MKNLFRKWRGRSAAVLLVASTLAVQAVTDVKTLGGGPNSAGPAKSGATDGDTFAFAKFRNPFSIAIDTNGNLLVADQGNNKIRKVSNPGASDSLTSTFASRLRRPVGIAIDASNFVYVVTQGDGKLHKFSGNGALLSTISGFRAPTAVALGSGGVLFVAELGGNIYRILPDSTTELVASGFRKPRGLAVLANGLVAVTETTGHTVQLLDPDTGVSTVIAGSAGRGLMDGPGDQARFNAPHSIAVAPNGSLVVADRLNHRVRVIDTNYFVSTLYGVPKSQWSRVFAGWVDGAGGESGIAASREPVGLTVASNGTVYVGEIFWDLLRQASGTGLGSTNGTNTNGGGGGGNGGNGTVHPAPSFAPTYGYYPFGVTVTVTSTVPVRYTTDGTEPTTNSRLVVLNGNVGTIWFAENTRDLKSLRLKAISNAGTSVTVGGQSAPANEIGIPRDFVAGAGATILVPVVANLRTNARIQSFQYVVRITPLNGSPNILPYLRAQSIGLNDYAPLVTPALPGKIANYIAQPDDSGREYIAVFAGGTNANVDFQNFATTTLLVIPIDPAAPDGSSYRIRVDARVSASSEGLDVPVFAGPDRTITIASVPYLVGDVAPGAGYNAGEFGDFDLRNNDVNGVLLASVGIKTPFPFTDVFNAMDAHPPEPGGIGDGDVDYSDWQVVFKRSLGLDANNWTRTWFNGGLQSDPVPLSSAAPSKSSARASSASSAKSGTWSRGATLVAGNIAANGSGECSVPVWIKVAPGQSVGGLCFRAVIESANGAPAVTGVSFTPELGGNGFISPSGAANNETICAWNMVPTSSFVPLLQSNQFLGTLTFTLPSNVAPSDEYRIRFIKPSGAQNLETAVSFEGIPGSVWILGNPSPAPAQQTSDEWRVNFFGSKDAPEAADNADPDGDGRPNAQEYLQGKNPTAND